MWLPRVEMGSVHTHGSLAGLRDLEADLANLSGSVLAGTHRTSIEVNRYSLKARSPAMPASAEGTGATRLELPSSTGKNLSLWTTFDGYVGDAPLAARLGLDGTALDVVADIPRRAPKRSVRSIRRGPFMTR